MHSLTNKELESVNGGVAAATYLIITGAVVFLIGVVDGFIRPLKCRK